MKRARQEYVRGDVLVPRSDALSEQRQYYVMGGEAGIPSFLTSVDPSTGDRVTSISELPTDIELFLRPRKGTPQRKNYDVLALMLGGALESGASILSSVIAQLAKASGFQRGFVEDCIRAFVGSGMVLAKQRGADVELRLSALQREYERHKAYAASFAHELEAQSAQIGRLIGHAATAGGHREELLRTLIQNHIPRRFHAATGFVVGIPNQLDIIIYDRIEYSPLFRAGDLVVVPHASVRAILEVKSNLTSGQLSDALRHLDEARPFSKPPVFVGVFGYRGAAPATLIKAIKDFHVMKGDDDFEKHSPITGVADIVNAVCVLQKTILVTDFLPSRTGDELVYIPSVIELKTWSERNAEAAVFFDYISRFLRHPFDGERLDQGLSPLLAGDLRPVRVEPIYGRDWGPYELDQYIEEFESDVRAFRRWWHGSSWHPQKGQS
jgi:hypothetical protein